MAAILLLTYVHERIVAKVKNLIGERQCSPLRDVTIHVFPFSLKVRKVPKVFERGGLSCRYLGRILRQWRDDPEIQDGCVRRE